MGYKIVELTTREELRELQNSRSSFIVKATASWCRPCKAVQPLVLSLMSTLPYNTILAIVDVNQGADLSSFLKVKAIPAFFSYIQGEPMFSYVGCDAGGVKRFFAKTARGMGAGLPPVVEGEEDEDDK